MLKKSKKLLSVSLASLIAIGAPITSLAQVEDYQIEYSKEDLSFDALDMEKENEKILEVSNKIVSSESNFKNKNNTKKDVVTPLTLGQPLELEFDDGSKIVYELKVDGADSKVSTLNLLESRATSRRYEVVKTYYAGGIGIAQLKLTAEASHSGRYVTINRAYQDYASGLANVSMNPVKILVKTAYNSNCAIAEASGTMGGYIPKLGNIASRSYRFQIWVDPAGLAYLKTIS